LFILVKKYLILMTFVMLVFILTACLPENGPYDPSVTGTPTHLPSMTASATGSGTLAAPEPGAAATDTPQVLATNLPLPSSTSPSVPSPKPNPISSPIPVLVSPDTVNVPILLYHHIAEYSGAGQDYYVGIQSFQDQMGRLKEWGYTTITISDLAAAIRSGKGLPQRPIVITFDDSNLDVYQNALPVMIQYGFKAVMYVILNSIGADQGLSIAQIQELAASGWEIGSHSYTHTSLLKSQDLQKEICLSRYNLAKATGLEILTFAYPFGLADRYVTQYARDCGYTSAAGLGPSIRQSADDLYYLNRLTVLGGWSLDEFSSHLPWQSP
jgi:peptidoglycan/xylan/chitin deacetylase (PgdA/CDA1 family)